MTVSAKVGEREGRGAKTSCGDVLLSAADEFEFEFEFELEDEEVVVEVMYGETLGGASHTVLAPTTCAISSS